jgi:hypothetical protein
MSTSPDYCPACGLLIFTSEGFRWHLETIQRDEAHTAALWSLLGVDYQTLKAEGRERAEDRARERGWRLL